MAAVQRLGGDVRRRRLPVPGKRQAGDGLAVGLEAGAQPVGQRALARPVDTLYRDQHAASVTLVVVFGFPARALVIAAADDGVGKTGEP